MTNWYLNQNEHWLFEIYWHYAGVITKYLSMDELTASKEFYNSEVYSLLEQEDTKLWHLSALTLFTMFQEEKETGTITFPEEA